MIALRGILGTLVELFQLMWARRLWWLMPLVFVLLMFAALIVLGSTAGVGPFVYTLF